jgi:hypothetical protein
MEYQFRIIDRGCRPITPTPLEPSAKKAPGAGVATGIVAGAAAVGAEIWKSQPRPNPKSLLGGAAAAGAAAAAAATGEENETAAKLIRECEGFRVIK